MATSLTSTTLAVGPLHARGFFFAAQADSPQ
jgi:hypothetical protein